MKIPCRKTDKLGRTQYSKSERWELVHKYQRSGMSQSALCKAYGLIGTTLSGWLHLIRDKVDMLVSRVLGTSSEKLDIIQIAVGIGIDFCLALAVGARSFPHLISPPAKSAEYGRHAVDFGLAFPSLVSEARELTPVKWLAARQAESMST